MDDYLEQKEPTIDSPYTPSNPPQAELHSRFRSQWEGNILVEKEPGEEAYPKDGFISDFVLATQGLETTTLFAVWAALFGVSSILKRDVWFHWFPQPLFPNLYVIMCAPPGIVKKTTIIDFIDEVMEQVPSVIKDPIIKAKKDVNVLRGEITPQALHDKLAPERRRVVLPTGEFTHIDRGSQLAIMVSELATLLGQQKYNTGLVEKITSLFDGRAVGDDRETKAGGLVRLKNVFVTMLGGLTPEHFAESLPTIALGGGFMSRAIVVFQEKPTRWFPIPKQIKGAPDSTELARRLAWIAENSEGEYFLSEMAYEAYVLWYKDFKATTIANPDSEEERDRKVRMDNLILRTAVLLRAQRYESGNEISFDDFRAAVLLVTTTFKANAESLSESVSSNQSNFMWYRILTKIHAYIEKRGGVRRRQLLSFMSKYCTSKQINHAIEQLAEMGTIRIMGPDGRERRLPSRSGVESYVFLRSLRYIDEKTAAFTDSTLQTEDPEDEP